MKKFILDLTKDYKYARKETNSYFTPLINPNIYSIFLYRLSNFFFRYKLGIIAKFFWLINRLIFTVDIHQASKLSGGLMLVHGFGIVIGKEVISDGNLKIYQNVTLGGNSFKTKIYNNILLHQPYCKSDVIIYSGAVVIGPIVIGTNSIIGANSTITKSVENNSMVVGNNKKVKT